MARVLEFASNVSSAATAAAETGVLTNRFPFVPGRKAAIDIRNSGVTGTPTTLIQTSPDDTTYITVATHTGLGDLVVEVTLDKYIRLNRTVAGSAGRVSAYVWAPA